MGPGMTDIREDGTMSYVHIPEYRQHFSGIQKEFHSIRGGVLMLVMLLTLMLFAFPGQASATDLGNNTDTSLSGAYTLTEDISGKAFTVTDDTTIDLNDHTIKDESGNLTAFTVSAGKTLTVTGNGKDENYNTVKEGINGYGIVFKLEQGATLNLEDLQVKGAEQNAIYAVGNNIAINMDNTLIAETDDDGESGAVYLKGDSITVDGNSTTEINKSDTGNRFGGGYSPRRQPEQQ